MRTAVVASEGHIFRYGFQASVSQANGDILYSSCEFATQPLRELQELHWARGYERGTLIEPRSLYGYELVAASFDGSEKRRLTTTHQMEHWAVWSLDGKRFAYVEDRNAVVVGEEGSRARTLSSSGAAYGQQVTGPPRWSPDSTKILFIRGGMLHVVDLETKEGVRVVSPGRAVLEGAFSPDGNHIVWAGAGEDGHVVYVGPVDGSSKRKVAEFPSAEFPSGLLRELHWSPAGPLILFHFSYDDGSREWAQGLYVVNQDGTDLKRVRGSSKWGGGYLVRWSPDGSRIAIGGGGGVATMASDGTDLKVLAKQEQRIDRGHFYYAIVAANPRPPHPPVDPAACSSGIVIPDPEANPGLVADCEALLMARDWLAGDVFLDWHENLPIQEWEGVTVAGQPARVTDVVLRGLGLNGRMPPSFGQLGHLQRLDLWHNEIRGQIPREFGDLTRLRSLDLSYNLIVGAIPPELGRLTDLDLLDLSHNQLSGPIPGDLGALVNLRVLKLQDNNVGGAFPEELGDLMDLEELRLSRNRNLEGCVPDTLRAVEAVGTLLQRCWPDEDE